MRIPSAPPSDDLPALFAAERATLLQFLESLRDEEWNLPTRCEGWRVIDLTLHLVGDDLSLLARRRDGHHGTVPPDGLDEFGFVDWLDELQMEWVHAARRISPRTAIDLLRVTGAQLHDVFASEDPTATTAAVSWAGPGPHPVWLDQVRELSEFWIHRQQLREALGQDDDLDPAALVPILLGLRWAWAHRIGAAGHPTTEVVEFRVGAPVDQTWTLAHGEGGWGFNDDAAPAPTTVATLSARESWRLLTNNHDGAPSDLSIEGPAEVAATLRRSRAIIGRPKER